MSAVSEAVALEFRDPSGEPLRFEWRADELAAFDVERQLTGCQLHGFTIIAEQRREATAL